MPPLAPPSQSPYIGGGPFYTSPPSTTPSSPPYSPAPSQSPYSPPSGGGGGSGGSTAGQTPIRGITPTPTPPADNFATLPTGGGGGIALATATANDFYVRTATGGYLSEKTGLVSGEPRQPATPPAVPQFSPTSTQVQSQDFVFLEGLAAKASYGMSTQKGYQTFSEPQSFQYQINQRGEFVINPDFTVGKSIPVSSYVGIMPPTSMDFNLKNFKVPDVFPTQDGGIFSESSLTPLQQSARLRAAAEPNQSLFVVQKGVINFVEGMQAFGGKVIENPIAANVNAALSLPSFVTGAAISGFAAARGNEEAKAETVSNLLTLGLGEVAGGLARGAVSSVKMPVPQPKAVDLSLPPKVPTPLFETTAEGIGSFKALSKDYQAGIAKMKGYIASQPVRLANPEAESVKALYNPPEFTPREPKPLFDVQASGDYYASSRRAVQSAIQARETMVGYQKIAEDYPQGKILLKVPTSEAEGGIVAKGTPLFESAPRELQPSARGFVSPFKIPSEPFDIKVTERGYGKPRFAAILGSAESERPVGTPLSKTFAQESQAPSTPETKVQPTWLSPTKSGKLFPQAQKIAYNVRRYDVVVEKPFGGGIAETLKKLPAIKRPVGVEQSKVLPSFKSGVPKGAQVGETGVMSFSQTAFLPKMKFGQITGLKQEQVFQQTQDTLQKQMQRNSEFKPQKVDFGKVYQDAKQREAEKVGMVVTPKYDFTQTFRTKQAFDTRLTQREMEITRIDITQIPKERQPLKQKPDIGEPIKGPPPIFPSDFPRVRPREQAGGFKLFSGGGRFASSGGKRVFETFKLGGIAGVASLKKGIQVVESAKPFKGAITLPRLAGMKG